MNGKDKQHKFRRNTVIKRLMEFQERLRSLIENPSIYQDNNWRVEDVILLGDYSDNSKEWYSRIEIIVIMKKVNKYARTERVQYDIPVGQWEILSYLRCRSTIFKFYTDINPKQIVGGKYSYLVKSGRILF